MKINKLFLVLTSVGILHLNIFAQDLTAPIVGNEVVFEESGGIVAVEAEYFFKQTKSEIRQWYRTSKNERPSVGRDEDPLHCKNTGNNAYLEILPDTRVTHGDKLTPGENFSNVAGQMSILHYKVFIHKPGRYYVWVRAFSTGSEDNGLHVGIGGTWPDSGQRLQWCEGKNTWRWESKQRTQTVHCGEPYLIFLDIEKSGLHEITFSMREDGFEFDRFILARDKKYVPEGIGPEVTLASGNLPEPYPIVNKNPAAKPSFLYAVEKSVQGMQLIRASNFSVEGTNYYLDRNGKWLAIDPDQFKKATATTTFNGKNGIYDLMLLAVGENDGNSTYFVTVNDHPIGTFTSPPSKYSFQEGAKYISLFGNIQLSKGDILSVTSEVGSNDGAEYSRARWGGIALAPAGSGATALASLGDAGTTFNVGDPAPSINSSNMDPDLQGELKKWHKVTLTFDGPDLSESGKENPFMHYRFNVLFSHTPSGKSYKVPGYFAADGNAGETSATAGNKWRVHFAPPDTGDWSYKVDFRSGNYAAVSEKKTTGESGGYMDGVEGSFHIGESDKTGNDLRGKGRLFYDGTRYLKFSETGKPLLKVGPDAPENFLAYQDFDGTFHRDGHKDDLVKTWAPHLKHWKSGDPTWKDGKGKAIIGAINYLASKGMNAFSFLTNNIAGDDQNVFPYIDYTTYDRFDCSKLDQWEVVFEHADKLGMFLHFKTLEAENQGLLDNGAIGANTKLYYRELIARFGHHLALNWNIGEEIGDWLPDHRTPPLFKVQRLAAAQYFYDHDPYHHHVVIHNGAPFDDILGPESRYTGISLQTNKPDFSRVHRQVLRWLNASEKAGKQWAVAVDEPGDAQHSLLPDAEDPNHDNARINGLWGAFMAGAWGTEWYFGYRHAHSDLTCQDYASRDLFWDQCKILVDFFEGNEIPLDKTKNVDKLVSEGDYGLAIAKELYIGFLKKGSGSIDLTDVEGDFKIRWYNPRKGGPLQQGSLHSTKGGSKIEFDSPPSDPGKDWVILMKEISSKQE